MPSDLYSELSATLIGVLAEEGIVRGQFVHSQAITNCLFSVVRYLATIAVVLVTIFAISIFTTLAKS